MKPIIQIKETAETQIFKDNNGKTEPEKDKKNEGENPAAWTPQTPTEMTVEQKATALIAEIKKMQ
ncbi:hypothetical protein NWP96_00110 [Mycoplasmopsis cynos]|nr:hypothetical protein [Mycoplasmopsis cynos]